MSQSFEDLLEDTYDNEESSKPFHVVKDKGDKAILKWLTHTVETLKAQGRDRHQIQRANLAAYRGLQYSSQNSREGSFRNSDRLPSNKMDKLIINHLFDLTETKIAQMTRQRPAVDVLPSTDEFEDKNAARAVQKLMQHLWYINDVDAIDRLVHKYKFILGEAYLFVDWDPEAGDQHPDWEPNMPEVDENGEPTGKLLKDPVFTGDVVYKPTVPWRVYLERAHHIKDSNYCFRIEEVHIEDLRKEYPEKKNQIKEDKNVSLYDVQDMEYKQLKDHVIVYEFYHKKYKFCREGAYIKFTADVILEQQDHKFNHGNLPFIRLTDIDIPDKLHAISFYDHARPIQNMHNNLTTMLAKNIYLTGHAKWVMPRGACKIESLGNDNTIVQYQGAVPPQLLQTSPNPSESYNFRSMLKEEMEQVCGVSGVSRGKPPTGVTAAVAMQFLNEQEQERANTHIAKRSNFIEQLARMTIAVAGDFYQEDDGRMMRIMGKDDFDSVEAFQSAHLSKSYDIRIKGGSALPEQKSAKMQRIIELIQYKPEAMPNEQLIELLEFGNVDKFQSIVTEAVKAAEAENEEMLQGAFMSEPQEYEDSIVHWRIHVQVLQKKSYKEKVPQELREQFEDHIETTEYMMIEKAKINPLFQSKLAQLELFPIFYKDEEFTAMSAEQAQQEVQGAANRGEPTDAQIPGQDAAALPKQ